MIYCVTMANQSRREIVAGTLEESRLLAEKQARASGHSGPAALAVSSEACPGLVPAADRGFVRCDFCGTECWPGQGCRCGAIGRFDHPGDR